MTSLRAFRTAGLALALLSAGCTGAEVGDECGSNFECDAQSGAICDVTIPAGYCTFEGCVPNGCPDASVCVRFDERTNYCMKACQDNGDCRDGHACASRGSYGEDGYGYCYLAGRAPAS